MKRNLAQRDPQNADSEEDPIAPITNNNEQSRIREELSVMETIKEDKDFFVVMISANYFKVQPKISHFGNKRLLEDEISSIRKKNAQTNRSKSKDIIRRLQSTNFEGFQRKPSIEPPSVASDKMNKVLKHSLSETDKKVANRLRKTPTI